MVTFSFKCTEADSVNLKIRLRYDNLQQGLFFRELIKMYISQDHMMMEAVEDIKRRNNRSGRARLSNAKKDHERGRNIMENLGITTSEKQKIFDLIEEGEQE